MPKKPPFFNKQFRQLIAIQNPIIFGFIASIFFSSTFILNRFLGLQEGHWFWTAFLRYLYTVFLIVLIKCLQKDFSTLLKLFKLFFSNFFLWSLAGGMGCGVFYTGLTYSAGKAPGWVIATAYQTTILATPLILKLFGHKPSGKSIFLAFISFIGILLVQFDQLLLTHPFMDSNGHHYIDNVDSHFSGSSGQWIPAWIDFISTVLPVLLPILLAAFAYPLGNQIQWEALQGKLSKKDHSILTVNPMHKLFLMALGSFPYWILLGLILQPSSPTQTQLSHTWIVAISSSLIATTLFFKARQMSKNANELTAVDATQSLEVIFTGIGERLLISCPLPGWLSMIGVFITLVGQLTGPAHQYFKRFIKK